MTRLFHFSLLLAALVLSRTPPPATTFRTWPGTRVIAIIGDSWVRNDYITAPLRTRLPSRLYAFGTGGATTATYLTANLPLWDELHALHPDLVILLMGTNDQREILPHQLRTNMARLIARVRLAVPGVDVLVVAPGDNGVPRRLPMAWYSAALRAAAGDGRALFFDSASVLGTFGEATARDWYQGLAHVNRFGGTVVADGIYEMLSR